MSKTIDHVPGSPDDIGVHLTPEKEIVEAVMRAQDICILSNRILSGDSSVVSSVIVELLMLRREKKHLRGLLTSVRNSLANDATALSFQTLGQYRTAFVQAIDKMLHPESGHAG